MNRAKLVLISLFCLMLLAGCQEEANPRATTGYIEARLFIVTTPVAGEIKRMYVEEGQLIKDGQWLAKVDQYKTLTAPADGRVMSVFHQQKEWVGPGTALMSLLLPSQIEVVFYLPVIHLQTIREGQLVSIVINGQHYSAKILSISPTAEYTPDSLFREKHRHKSVFKVKAEVNERLRQVVKPGQTVDVRYD